MGAGARTGKIRHLMIRVGTDPNSGFCGGVIRAIDTAEKILLSGEGRLYSLGAIVHNEKELSRLEARGLRTVDHDGLAGLGPGDTVLIRAHGEPPATYSMLTERGVKVTDCTCPVVLRLQNRIREASGRSQVVIFGKIGHPEVLGLVGSAGGRATVVENSAQLLESIAGGTPDGSGPVELFSQTTMNPETYARIAAILREAVGDRLTVHDSICSRMAARHREIGSFASQYDVIVFVSGGQSSNGKVLFDRCRSINPRTYMCSAPEELQASWFEGAESAGVCGATSTPRWLLDEVAAAIEDLH